MIFFVVREEDTHLQSPFTQPLSASMMILKEKQSKEKAHPPGTSKILAKARKKAMEEEKKVCCFYLKRTSLCCIWKKPDTDLHFPIKNVRKLLYLKYVYCMKMINAAYQFLCRVTKKLHPMKKKKTRAKKHGDRARSLRSNWTLNSSRKRWRQINRLVTSGTKQDSARYLVAYMWNPATSSLLLVLWIMLVISNLPWLCF